MTTETLQNLSPVWGRITDIVMDDGAGSCLYDTAGRRYLDFTCGIGVTNTGHAHPRVVKAIQDQAAKIIHSQANIAYSLPLLQLTDELLGIVPPRP